MNAKVNLTLLQCIMESFPLVRDVSGRPGFQALAHLSTVSLTILAGTA